MREEETILQIVPRLPPQVDGVGHYAFLLAEALFERYGLRSHFVTFGGGSCSEGGNAVGTVLQSGFDYREFTEVLRRCGSIRRILLHYVGYGYSPRGVPTWLVRALEEHTALSNCELFTYLHELYASGPPWRSSFWLRPFQRRLMIRLARASRHCFVSRKEAIDEVSSASGVSPVRISAIAMASTVGESDPVHGKRGDRSRLVMFGGAGRRRAAYSDLGALEAILASLQARELLDVGPQIEGIPDRIGEARVVPLGTLPDAKVRDLLQEACAGIVHYPAHLLGKSSIFAAYCAHGVVPIVIGEGARRIVEGAQPGVHFLYGADLRYRGATPELLQSISDGCKSWYGEHNMAAHAALISNVMRESEQNYRC